MLMQETERQTSLDQRRHHIADRVKPLIAAADGQGLGPGDIAFCSVKRAWHLAVEIIIGHEQFQRLLVIEHGRRRMPFGQIEMPARPDKVGDDGDPGASPVLRAGGDELVSTHAVDGVALSS